jgi:TRAP-type uncharacterized transport system substrate-binding protein
MNKRLGALFLFFVGAVFIGSCDYYATQKKFRLAVADSDYLYGFTSDHFKTFLESQGYTLEIIHVPTVFKACEMVAEGKADLTTIMNHSTFVSNLLGAKASNLRTIMPLYHRAFFLFSRTPIPDTTTVARLFSGKRIGIERLQGETQFGLEMLLADSEVKDAMIVQKDDSLVDLIHFWGALYNPRHLALIKSGWHGISLNPEWVRFIDQKYETMKPLSIPPVPSSSDRAELNTVMSETLLICNANLGDKAIYDLSTTIFQNKMHLVNLNHMYRYISEQFDQSALLFSVHAGLDAYLHRNEPTFFERYSDTIALFFSIAAIFYGAFTAVRQRMERLKKERIDLYFLELLTIRSMENIDKQDREKRLDQLLQRAIVQMTNERLDKVDFDIFSRFVQQEIALLH